MIVLDTNVLSEAMKPADLRSSAVVDWMQRHPLETLFTTCITMAEVLAGIAILPEGRRRSAMEQAAELVFATVFPGRVLPFEEGAARHYATVVTASRKQGRNTGPLDFQIASIALSRGMAVATRNVKHFEDTGLKIINPWDA